MAVSKSSPDQVMFVPPVSFSPSITSGPSGPSSSSTTLTTITTSSASTQSSLTTSSPESKSPILGTDNSTTGLPTCHQGAPDLPDFIQVASPVFKWGELDAKDFIPKLESTYAKVVHWRRNIFDVPTGNAGTAFVLELSRLFRAYAEGSALGVHTITAEAKQNIQIQRS